MIDVKDKTVAEIVSNDISAVSVFKKYNIDFCCGGQKTIEKVCYDTGIELAKLTDELNSNKKHSVCPNLDFGNWDICFLIDYIINVHHVFVKNNIDIINSLGEKVARVHGSKNIEIIEIVDLFSKMSKELICHLKNEEEILFPEIKHLKEHTNESEKCLDKIAAFEHEHEEVGVVAKRIISLSNNFTTPEKACNTYKAFYFKLNEFIDDLFQHIHLENNILFTKIKVLT